MSERNELPRTLSTATPASPSTAGAPGPGSPLEDEARARIAALDREARAMGNVPAAAPLFHEIGLLWEAPLKNPRNAAVAYQAAFRLAPKFLANIRAARKLFAEVNNWAMVVTLLDAELSATETRRTRAALLFERAQLLDQRLSRGADAVTALAQCLALDPEDVSLLVQLDQAFSEKNDFPSLVKVYRLMAGAMTDNTARAHYLTSAGLLLEDRLKDHDAAGSLFRDAFRLDRHDPQLLSAMKRLAQREGTIDEELAALAAEAEGQGALAGPTFLQISRAYERLNRPADALSALLAAQRVTPNDPLVMAELARIYEAQGRYQELADILLAWAERATAENEFVSLNLRLASLYEEQLKREQDAMARYRAVLARVPGHANALSGLGKLCYRGQNWQGLVDAYEAEAAATNDPRQKASRLYKAGETLEERLNRTDEAIARYLQCLQLSPGFLPAKKSLTRLLEKLGRWADLVAMYEQDLMPTTDRELQLTTLNLIATIHEDRLGDVSRAIDSLRRVLELAPDHVPTLHNLARLFERSARWQELIALHDLEARLSSDPNQVVSLAHRNAELIEEQLRDRAGATTAWERVIQLAPTYQPALRALGRLYGQDGRWGALILMYRAEAGLAASTEQAAALVQKIGELNEQKLANTGEAIAAYREVLTLSPSDPTALGSLARIYRAQGSWESLIEILHAEAANRTDPTERANAMFQAAGLWEDQLGKPDQAIAGYQEVLRLAPVHTAALANLERLLTARDDLKELVVLLDRQSQVGAPTSRVAALLKLARLYLDRLNEPARAATCCESALMIDSSSLSVLRLLERIRANDKPRRAEIRTRIADTWGDARLAAAIRLSNIDQPPHAVPPDDVLNQLRAAHAADPSDEALGLTLERALQKVGDAAGLVEIYERRRSVVTDPADHLQLSLRIGELCETRLNDLPRAITAWRVALEQQPDLHPALVGLFRCHLKLGDGPGARAALEAIANTGRDPATVTQALLDAARLARDLERNDELAIALFGKVLEREPLHPEAGPGLEEILARRGGSGDLAALHEKRGESRLAQGDVSGAAQEFYGAARLHLDQLKNRERASAALDRALAAVPAFAEALELKGDLAFEVRDFQTAAMAYSHRVQQGGDPQRLAHLHLKLGAIFHDQLGDPARAAAHLQTAVSAMPTSIEALERLASIHTNSRNWTGAVDCLRRLLELESSLQSRGKYTLALARIFDEGLQDPSQALALYKRALEFVPGDQAVLDRLVALCERLGNQAELVRLLEQQAHQSGDVKRAVSLRLRIAGIYAKALNDPQRAIQVYRQVLEVEPAAVSAWVALAELFGREQNSVALAVDAHRNILKHEPTRVDSLHALFRMWEALRQLDKAFCAAALLVFLRSANEVEQAYFSEARNRLPGELKGALSPQDVVAVHHPAARSALVDVLKAVGDQLSKLYPPQFEAQGIDRKADRLKADHAIFKAVHSVASLFALEEFEVYQSRRGLVTLETTEPVSICLGSELIRRFNVREQRFHIGRGVLGLVDKTAVLRRVSAQDAADLLGNSVRIHCPEYQALGRRSDDQSKALRKAYSRKAIKALEEPAAAIASAQQVPAVEALIQGLTLSADRVGMLVCADPTAGLNLVLKEDPTARQDSADGVLAAVQQRLELRELVGFAVSDDFFRLRQRVGVSLG